ncbi:MAG: hypothetical protein JWN32_712, partial [Solirubrobacterales bacterium]|nr:hypothetical protein [Solirubrobacterales bacterium]
MTLVACAAVNKRTVQARRLGACVGGGVLLLLALAIPPAARATLPCTHAPNEAGPGTHGVQFTGGVVDSQCWVVPPDVIAATFDLWGAAGADNGNGTVPGGKGAHVRATIPVTPGMTVQVDVGRSGSGEAGGFNGGGGSGRPGSSANASGGGGGASDIRGGAFGPSDRLIVAGGGGGAAGNGIFCDDNGLGGAGGNSHANGLAASDLLPGAHGGGPGLADGSPGLGGAGSTG